MFVQDSSKIIQSPPKSSSKPLFLHLVIMSESDVQEPESAAAEAVGHVVVLPPPSQNEPPEVEHLVLAKDTTELDLTRTRQTEVPECLAQLPALRSLCMRWNLLSQISAVTNQLSHTLTHLDLYDNQITRIENLDNLVQLQVLDLSFNRLTAIEGLSTLVNLRKLYLVHNKIGEITGLEHNQQLTLLELGDNKIKTIQNISHLSKLEYLYLGANRIRAVPCLDGLGQLVCLSLPCNRLIQIPPKSFDAVPHLQELYLSQNALQQIPDLSSNTELQVLDLNDNQITKLENLSHLSLTDLWMRKNRLEDLEPTLAALQHMKELKVLYLEFNGLCGPATSAGEHEYRRRTLLALPQLHRLDAQPTRNAAYWVQPDTPGQSDTPDQSDTLDLSDDNQ